MTKIQHIRFVSKAPNDPVSLGDLYEEFLCSGATVLKEVTLVHPGGVFEGRILKTIRLMPEGSVLHKALPVLPDSKRTKQPKQR